jgi:hypothetical protein
MAITVTALSLFRHTCELKTLHHFIVVECGCMDEFVDGIVNLAQILENVVQMFARNLLTPLPHCH